MKKAFQDYYPEHFSHCYGCGRLNDAGYQIKSYWDGEETVCQVVPQAHYTAIPGIVYGGYIASVIDCHSTGTASAAAYKAEGRDMDTKPALRFVTASLHVDYLRPTPIDGPIEIRASVKELKGRKVVVATQLIAGGQVCARGEVVAVQVPENFLSGEK